MICFLSGMGEKLILWRFNAVKYDVLMDEQYCDVCNDMIRSNDLEVNISDEWMMKYMICMYVKLYIMIMIYHFLWVTQFHRPTFSGIVIPLALNL